jgi:hypothetical protein
MADFAEGVSDDVAKRRLARAIRGKGAFRRFRDELYEEYPELVSAWHAFRDNRAQCRAVEWLLDEGFIDEEDAERFWRNIRTRTCPEDRRTPGKDMTVAPPMRGRRGVGRGHRRR